ncbi:MAG: hypothetical protein KDA24_25485, partial [Deltaproteobacteria bacterium]|nr:hypothetical protein [Deltaproteobacteria bacterium]
MVRLPLLLLAVVLCGPAFAHEGASARLSQLNGELALTPNAPHLLLQRARELRRSGDLSRARADIERAALHHA